MHKKGFTLIELLIVIGIIAILAAAVIIAISPGERLAEARDSTRERHLLALESALYIYQIDDSASSFPAGITSTLTEICNTDKVGSGDCDGLVDISDVNITIPVDPGGVENDHETGYEVARDDDRIILSAPNAEIRVIAIGDLPYPWPDAEGYIYNESEHEDMWVEGYADEGTGSKKEADHLYIDGSGIFGGSYTYVTDLVVDLTGYNLLKIDWSLSCSDSGGVYLVASTDKTASWGTYDARLGYEAPPGEDLVFDRRVESLDVSGLSGNHYIRVHGHAPSWGLYGRVWVYKVWLE